MKKLMDLKTQGIWALGLGCFFLGSWLLRRQPLVSRLNYLYPIFLAALIIYAIWLILNNLKTKIEPNNFTGILALAFSILPLGLTVGSFYYQEASSNYATVFLWITSSLIFIFSGITLFSKQK